MPSTVVFVWLLSISLVSCSNFGRKPAEGYFQRSNISDCVERFYRTERENEQRGFPDFPMINEPAISGGFRAFNGEYPHMAAIGWTVGEKVQYMCGGTLIHPKFVLTAAHCAVSIGGSLPTTVRLGDTDLSSSLGDHLAKQINIQSIRRHPLHRFARSYHDIALVELATEAPLSSAVYPACLWREELVPNEPLRITGFGELEEASGNSPTLQQGRVQMLNKELCRGKIRVDRRIPDGLLDSQFCASHETMDTCQGDSGGPIEVLRVDLYDRVHPVVVGVTSFGTPCANGSTGVYTKISSYIGWIEEETKENFSYHNCINRAAFRKDGDSQLNPLYIPAYVHLLQNSYLSSEYGCAGTLIDDRYVLTSAHCVTLPNEAPEFVYFNSNGEAVQVDEIIVHPSYKPHNPMNDIALLKLSMYLKPNTLLRPICLEDTDSDNYPTYSFVFRSHLQRNSTNPKYSYHSKEITRSFKSCNDNIEENQICANNSLPILAGICQVDTGGPILSGRIPSTAIPFMEGVTGSQSEGCAGKLFGIKIKPHIRWIESVILKTKLYDVLIFS